MKKQQPLHQARDNGNSKSGFLSESRSDDSSSGSSDSDESSSSSSESESDSEEEEEEDEEVEKKVNGEKEVEKSDESSEGTSTSSSSGSSESESSGDEENEAKPKVPKVTSSQKQKQRQQQRQATKQEPRSNLDLLLDFSEDPPSLQTPMLTPSLGGFLSPASSESGSVAEAIKDATTPAFVPTRTQELLNKMTSGGLQVLYRYTRSPHIYAPELCSIELTLNNLGDSEQTEVKAGARPLPPGMALREFPAVASLAPGASLNVNIGINFNDTTQAAQFDLVACGRCHQVS